MKALVVSARPAWACLVSPFLKSRYNEVSIVSASAFDRRSEAPDLLLVDCVQLPAAFEAIALAAEAYRSSRILALVARPSDYVARAAREAGCHAALSETDNLSNWGVVLNRIANLPYQTGDSFRTAPRFLMYLTPRQLEAYEFIARGFSDQQLASELGVTTSTAETHRQDVQHKLNCASHRDVLAHALLHGVIDPCEIPAASSLRRVTRSHSGSD